MATRQIQLLGRNWKAWRTVKAHVYGPFGVHRGEFAGFTVTHIQSGLAVDRGAESIPRGLSLARRLVALGVDWDFTDPRHWPTGRKHHYRLCVEKCVERWRNEPLAVAKDSAGKGGRIVPRRRARGKKKSTSKVRSDIPTAWKDGCNS